MKENKNIERLFQEKFKNFEATPPLDSWKNIEERLNQKKKKRRIIPFWFKTSGIAATLILGMFLFRNVADNSSDSINKIVIDNNAISNVEDSPTTTSNKETIEESNSGSSSIKKAEVLNASENNTVVFQYNNNNSTNPENAALNNKNTNKKKTSSFINNTNPIVVSSSEKSKTTSSNNKTVINNEVVVSNDIKKNLNSNGTVKLEHTNKLSSSIVTSEKKGKVTNNKLNLNLKGEIESNKVDLVINKPLDSNNNKLSTNNVVVVKSNNEANAIITTNTINSNNLNPDSIVLVQNNIIADAIEDSALVAEVNTEENPLEKLLKVKLEGKNVDEKEKEKRNKWAVSTNASPIYFNSTTQGSPIDEQFIENKKAYASSLSYGVGLEYEISKRFSIKSGVNSLAVNYNTNNVYYETSLNAVKQDNINITRNENARNIFLSNTNKTTFNGVSRSSNEVNQGDLKQEIGFVEVPLELSYKLVDRKLGINLVGGMSTLFLNTNTVSLISKGTEMDLGEANNLNNIHFSSNVGLGFKYTFWESFQANFQPTFKYQINTFSNDSGNFKPYFIGLYSGISFSF